MAIRVLRLIEYVYESPERAAVDMANWTAGRQDRTMTMRSAIMPFEVVPWTAYVDGRLVDATGLEYDLDEGNHDLWAAIERAGFGWNIFVRWVKIGRRAQVYSIQEYLDKPDDWLLSLYNFGERMMQIHTALRASWST